LRRGFEDETGRNLGYSSINGLITAAIPEPRVSRLWDESAKSPSSRSSRSRVDDVTPLFESP
jgi:hypothetical protein